MAYVIEPNVGLTWFSDADPTVPPGVPAPLYQFLVRTDNDSVYYKSGTASTAWTLISGGGGPATPLQTFRVVLDGTEGDTITVILPTPNADANYNPVVTLMIPNSDQIKSINVVDGSITNTQFDVVLGADAELDDTIMVTIAPLA